MKQKLIDQLLHKAGARFGAEGTDYSDFTSSKFAELIVKECVAQCWTVSEMEHKGDVISECSKRMRKHFGVEE